MSPLIEGRLGCILTFLSYHIYHFYIMSLFISHPISLMVTLYIKYKIAEKTETKTIITDIKANNMKQ